MKRLLPLFLLTFLLISCGVPSTPAPTATLTPSATVLPTSTLTATPEPTLTPTATLDPNAPQGTLGKDDKGSYIEANGVKYRQIELVNPKSGEKATIWAGMLNAGEKAIPLLDVRKISEDIGLLDQLWFRVYIDPSVPGAESLQLFSHPPRYEGNNVRNNMNFNDIYSDTLYFKRKDDLGRKIKDIEKPYLEIRDGKISLPFFTSAGEYKWKLGPNTNVTTIIRNINDLSLVEGNGVTEYKIPFKETYHFRAKMYAINGNLYCEIASEIPLDQLTLEEISAFYLFGPISVADGENQDTEQHWPEVFRLADWAIKPPISFF